MKEGMEDQVKGREQMTALLLGITKVWNSGKERKAGFSAGVRVVEKQQETGMTRRAALID